MAHKGEKGSIPIFEAQVEVEESHAWEKEEPSRRAVRSAFGALAGERGRSIALQKKVKRRGGGGGPAYDDFRTGGAA